MKKPDKARLLGLALLFGVLAPAPVLIAASVLGIAPHRHVSDVWKLLLLVAWVALPFLVLAFQSCRNWPVWVAGALATALIWLSFFVVVTGDRSHWDGSEGVGTGFVLLLSPLLVGFAMALSGGAMRLGKMRRG
jgi:hypothetical protein